MIDKIVDKITETVSRRGFLSSSAMAAAALTASLVFGPIEARAGVSDGCCTTCKTSSCPCTGCSKSFSWTCCKAKAGFFACQECYGQNTTCKNCICCSDVICSCASKQSDTCT